MGDAEVVGELGPAPDVPTDGLVVGLESGRAAPLGLVHGHVGLGETVLGVGVGQHGGDADAHRGVQLALPDRHRCQHCLLDPLGERPCGRLGLDQVLGQDDEFVATQSGHGVVTPDHLLQAGGDGHQQAVARGVTEPVVDGLEVVEVEEEEHGVGVTAVGPLRGLVEPVVQQGPVGEAGQLVVEGAVGEGGLLLVEAELEGAPGLVELAHDADQAPVAAETDHPQREVEQLVAHAQAHALLGEDARYIRPSRQSRPSPRRRGRPPR